MSLHAVNGHRGQNAPGAQGGSRPRVVVKLRGEIDLPYEDGVEKYLVDRGLASWEQLAHMFPGITLARLYTSMDTERLRALERRAAERDQTYDSPNLLSYFVIDCPPEVDPEALVKELSAWRIVEVAYIEGGPTPPPVVAGDDPRWPNQIYLDAAPDGINAEFAWTIAGGDGGGATAGLQFVDLEQGWTLNHEDLVAAGITLISGVSNAYFGHGTAVLGQVVSVDNGLGGIGITPNIASCRVVSQWRTATTYNTAEAILDAVAALDFGDILLLEAQTSAFGLSMVPVEVEDAVFDAIRLGTALGVVIVEAGGNGGNNLDTFTHPVKGQFLNRGSANFRDSGAILVGAASSTVPHNRLWFSSFGSRVDCYAWGEDIDTTGDGWTGNLTTSYTTSFGGTSGASPIITGAALALQGIAATNLGYRFSPSQLRGILSNPATGTTSGNPAADQIGVMPNLHAIITSDVLNLAPDIYLRDYVGDTGNPHSGAISASPDIILRPVAVADPQSAFGEGSGTENSATLGSEAEAGQDNMIYVRVRNRGGSTATNVRADVFWSPVATLVTPDLWTSVGSVTIPLVSSGDLLTVSDAITWPAAAIPGPGHYCLVGLIGVAGDPAPSPTDFMDWDNFRQFIRNNNNVTWRNFNVVTNVPPAHEAQGFIALDFLAPGAPDKARRMQLEVIARLPEGARVQLELPRYLADALFQRSPFEKHTRADRVVVPIKASGRHLLGTALFPARSRAELRLLVHIPEEARKYAYEIAVRQLYEQEEVGRVTWRLAPPERQDN
jgi:serine protease